jgi:hypothetical protein
MEQFSQSAANNQAPATSQPAVQSAALGAYSDAIQINDRIAVILGRIRPTPPQALDTAAAAVGGAERNGIPPLQMTMSRLSDQQGLTHKLLTELESLV